jgi:hypothetical protein
MATGATATVEVESPPQAAGDDTGTIRVHVIQTGRNAANETTGSWFGRLRCQPKLLARLVRAEAVRPRRRAVRAMRSSSRPITSCARTGSSRTTRRGTCWGWRSTRSSHRIPAAGSAAFCEQRPVVLLPSHDAEAPARLAAMETLRF